MVRHLRGGAVATPTLLCFDNVRVYRVDIVGPVWSTRDVDMFQDTFPSDGSDTGIGRADAALSITPSASHTILPGDSVRVVVSDPITEDSGDSIRLGRRRNARRQAGLSLGPRDRQWGSESHQDSRRAHRPPELSVQRHAGRGRQDLDADSLLLASSNHEHVRRRPERQLVRSRRHDRVLLRCDQHQRSNQLLFRSVAQLRPKRRRSRGRDGGRVHNLAVEWQRYLRQ